MGFVGVEEDLFATAVRCERSGPAAAAVTAYRLVLRREPDRAEAWYNLGNVLRDAGHAGPAEIAFRRAVRCDPAFAQAWFNLAHLLDMGGAPAAAIPCLEQALQAAPTYADAHFNLASCAERVGRWAQAKRHWLAYLRLDRASPWAEVARAHL